MLLEKNLDREIQELEAKSFGSELEKKYFFGGEKVLCQRKKVIKSEVADIVVQIEDKTDEEIIVEIVDKIKRIVPETRVTYAHGQMKKEELLLKWYHKLQNRYLFPLRLAVGLTP